MCCMFITCCFIEPPVSIPGLNQTNNLNNANGSTVQIANVIPEGLQNYFRSQEELQSRRMREIKEREKKGFHCCYYITIKASVSFNNLAQLFLRFLLHSSYDDNFDVSPSI